MADCLQSSTRRPSDDFFCDLALMALAGFLTCPVKSEKKENEKWEMNNEKRDKGRNYTDLRHFVLHPYSIQTFISLSIIRVTLSSPRPFVPKLLIFLALPCSTQTNIRPRRYPPTHETEYIRRNQARPDNAQEKNPRPEP